MDEVSSPRSTKVRFSHHMSSFLTQPTFEFRVGSEQTVLSVHVGLFDGKSKPLHTLMTGPMKEGQERVACLPTWEMDIVRAACEYAYRDSYTCPDHYQTSCGEGESHVLTLPSRSTTSSQVCFLLWYFNLSLHLWFLRLSLLLCD